MYILLCGYPPFYDDDNFKMLELISSNQYEFNPSQWDHISIDAKDLIQHLLVSNPKERFTASDCLQHAWFHLNHQENNLQTEQFLTNIKRFNAKRRLKKAFRCSYFSSFLLMHRNSDPNMLLRPDSFSLKNEDENNNNNLLPRRNSRSNSNASFLPYTSSSVISSNKNDQSFSSHEVSLPSIFQSQEQSTTQIKLLHKNNNPII
jgi:serine/threonine protein kinase